MNISILTISKVAVLALVVFSMQSQAATVSREFGGNDCSGYFGSGFDSCTIFVNSGGEVIELSPVIAKFDETLLVTGPESELNGTVFPSVDGNEFVFSNPVTENKTGTWTYTQGVDDPGVRYWATKAGPNFLLTWDVDDAEILSGGACDVSDVYVLACLDAANVVTTGDWATPNDQALSHITFYDTEGGGPPNEVPLPAAAWLFLSALGGMGLIKRTKR